MKVSTLALLILAVVVGSGCKSDRLAGWGKYEIDWEYGYRLPREKVASLISVGTKIEWIEEMRVLAPMSMAPFSYYYLSIKEGTVPGSPSISQIRLRCTPPADPVEIDSMLTLQFDQEGRLQRIVEFALTRE